MAVVLGICAFISPLLSSVDSVSAKSINGNPGINTPLSKLSHVFFSQNGTIQFDTRLYDNYTTSGLLDIISYNTLSANNFSDPSIRSANTGYKVNYGDIIDIGSIRPTQYQFNVSSTSTTNRNYVQLFFNNLAYNGSVSVQLPLNFYFFTSAYNDAVHVQPTVYSNAKVYVHYVGDAGATELNYTVYNDNDFLYISFDISGTFDDFSVHYSVNTNNTYFSNSNYFSYWFTNILFDTSGVQFNNGYLQGMTDANTTLNTDSVSYKTGYTNGVNTANNTINTNSASYYKGYDVGASESVNLYGIFSKVIEAPVQVFLDTFDFEIFGVNVSSFILSIITLCFIAVFIKLIF